MTGVWSIRRCFMCGRGVKCEPGYPATARVVCQRCLAMGAA